MRLRTFTAADMPAAMKMVRETLGDDAIIIASEQSGNNISVTAAADDQEEYAKPEKAYAVGGGASYPVGKSPQYTSSYPTNSPAAQLRFDLQHIFRFHNLPEVFIAKLMQKASPADMAAAAALYKLGGGGDQRQLHRIGLEKLIAAYFGFNPLPLENAPMRLMISGPPGIGKTLTVAKLATRLSSGGQAPTVITTDNKRAGGIEQLQSFTDILELPLLIAATPTELSRHLAKIPKDAPVLIDTAGCNPYDAAELAELKAYAASPGVEPVLALSAGGDSLETMDMVEAFSAIPFARLLVTRADSARRFGGVLVAAASHNLAFCNVSSSSSVVDALPPVDAALLAQLLLRYQLQSA